VLDRLDILLDTGKSKKVLLRLRVPEIAVTSLAFLLPDLIDKPLFVLGVISDGRYIGHTLLLVFLVALAFTLQKRVYGLFAVCAGMLHLLLDTRGLVPWFYPFKNYDLPSFDWHQILTWFGVAVTLVELVVAIIVVSVAVSLVLSFSSWVKERIQPRIREVSQSAASIEVERHDPRH
jgi:hypothetical protein